VLGPPRRWEYSCPTADATRELARRLVPSLPPGSVLGLDGELGAGKTTFVQGLAQGMGDPLAHQILSPTYTLLNEYVLPRGILVHMDAYRLDSAEQAEALGLLEPLHRPDIWVAVEWAQRLGNSLPSHTVRVQFEQTADGGRRCCFEGMPQPIDLLP
jgi:tRNA threonylcarbamoyladenosine biosynthesis protein TsaE